MDSMTTTSTIDSNEASPRDQSTRLISTTTKTLNAQEYARVNRVMMPRGSEEYRQRRERNNAAVKKSRHKSKEKTIETQRRVDQLKSENCELERRVETLTRELDFMRAIFVPRRDGNQQLPAHQQQQMRQQQ